MQFSVLEKTPNFKTVLLHQDTIAKVFLTRNKKINFGPNQNRHETPEKNEILRAKKIVKMLILQVLKHTLMF